MEDLADQIREDYLISVKKAIVDFVLKDHRELSVTGLDEEAKSSIYPPKDPHFTAVFKSSKAFCEENLHPYNKTLLQDLLKMWHTQVGFFIDDSDLVSDWLSNWSRAPSSHHQ